MKLRSTPALSLLEPFEAAARLGSFTRAAEELSVTQSAVSQRVRKLEDMLGAPLFTRHHRTIALTDDGRELLNSVTVALRHLTSSLNAVHRPGGRVRVKLGTDTAMAGLWLPRRLQEVLAADPALDIDLTVSDVEEDVLRADVAILHGAGTWPGFEARLLFADEIFPVCAPSYLARHPVAEAADLLRADLIDLDYVHWNWANWSIWLTETQLDAAQARILLRTNSYLAQIDAARLGLGVALGWRDVVADDLARGTLVRPVTESIASGFGYHVLTRHGSDEPARMLAARLVEGP
ncbi:MAG: LysR substrate-binding domain-containing protein [Roseovarius sp.]